MYCRWLGRGFSNMAADYNLSPRRRLSIGNAAYGAYLAATG